MCYDKSAKVPLVVPSAVFIKTGGTSHESKTIEYPRCHYKTEARLAFRTRIDGYTQSPSVREFEQSIAQNIQTERKYISKWQILRMPMKIGLNNKGGCYEKKNFIAIVHNHNATSHAFEL